MSAVHGRENRKLRQLVRAFRALLAAGVVGLWAQPGAAQSAPHWPDNPFALTLSSDLFPAAQEYRFDKAVRVFGEAMGGIGDDLFDIATFPLRDPATFGSFALGIGALVLVDKPTTTLYQQTLVPIGTRIDIPTIFPSSFITRDEQYVGAAIAGTYAYGLAANDERAQVAALLAAKAVLYSYFTSHVVLKAAFGRNRPVPDLASHTGPKGGFSTSPFEFFNSTGVHFNSVVQGTGMPSFHFTLYFSTARVYAGVYDNWVVPYGLATALALQSAEGHNHWVSDMVAGALIGTGIGNVVLSNYEDRKREAMGMVTPVVSSKGAGLMYQLRF